MTRCLFRCRSGAAAAEMALVLPILLALMFGSVELGNYFRSEHILLKGVRDASVYASRQQIDNYNCAASPPTVSAAVVNGSRELARTGELSGGSDLLPNWADPSTIFTVTAVCVTTTGGQTMKGIYQVNGGKVPVITMTASLPYRSVLGTLGLSSTTLRLNATEQAAVTGA